MNSSLVEDLAIGLVIGFLVVLLIMARQNEHRIDDLQQQIDHIDSHFQAPDIAAPYATPED